MSNEVNNIDIQQVDWKYLPNINQLSFYLARNDIIQLSLACRHLRLKLKSGLFSKLELMRGNEIIPGESNKPSKKKQLISLFEILEEDYLDRYDIVNHCIIWEFFNSRFARSFFNLFTNITQLELYSCFSITYRNHYFIDETVGGNNVLVEALYHLKSLESLKIGRQLINSSVSCSKLFLKLPLSLKILHVIECESSYGDLNFYPIENISEEYSNLKEVSIINNKMLNNMAAKMESLTDVTIFNNQDFSKGDLAKFFLLNTQIKKLSVPVYFLECSLANPILKMNQLKQLNIKPSYHRSSDEIYSLSANKSIEHLNIECDIDSDRLISILNSLSSIKVLEFSDFSFYSFMNIEFSDYEGRIPLLHLNCLWHAQDAISSFDNLEEFSNLEIFDRIRFTNMCESNFYLTICQKGNFKNWKVCHLDLADGEEFTLVKIATE